MEKRVYRIKHVTTYNYAQNVLLAHHQAHLTPRQLPHQVVVRSSLIVTPQPTEIYDIFIDYYGNSIVHFTLRKPHFKLIIQSTSRLENIGRILPQDTGDTVSEEGLNIFSDVPFNLRAEVADFLNESPYIPFLQSIQDYARQSFILGRSWLNSLLDLNNRIYNDFSFDSSATTVATTLDDIVSKKRGVCQDFTHFAIACLRSIGIPARYMSGYLLTHPLEGQEKLRGADASHAWLSAYLPKIGWVEIDPTNNCQPEKDHITLAWGRDYSDISPLRGIVLGGGDHSLHVAVDVDLI